MALKSAASEADIAAPPPPPPPPPPAAADECANRMASSVSARSAARTSAVAIVARLRAILRRVFSFAPDDSEEEGTSVDDAGAAADETSDIATGPEDSCADADAAVALWSGADASETMSMSARASARDAADEPSLDIYSESEEREQGQRVSDKSDTKID
jgi:hypothetical protein